MKTTINHVNKIICFSKVRIGTTSQFTWCYFGHFRGSVLFWSLWCFQGYFGHFGVFGVILVILGVLSVFWELFWPFLNF